MKVPSERWQEVVRLMSNDTATLWAATSDKMKWQILRDLAGSADTVLGPTAHMVSDEDVDAWREELGGAEVLRRINRMYPKKEERNNA